MSSIEAAADLYTHLNNHLKSLGKKLFGGSNASTCLPVKAVTPVSHEEEQQTASRVQHRLAVGGVGWKCTALGLREGEQLACLSS